MPKPAFDFSEQRNTIYYHSVRVFIFGADVTPWLTSNVVITKAGRDGIGSCTFSLSNAMRAFEITDKNINPSTSARGVFRTNDPTFPDGRYSELAKFQIYNSKVNSPTNTRTSIKTFGPVKGANIGGTIKDASNRASSSTDTFTTRYPMNIGSLVFHKYDPVRVFMQNPFVRGQQQWTCEFTGYLDTKAFSQNYVTGESVINMSCQDIRSLMQNMRTQSNPAPQVGNENYIAFGGSRAATQKDVANAGFFNDLVAPGSTLSHVLGGKSFKDSLKFILFGSFASSAGNQGVGKLSEGTTITYDPSSASRKDSLESWNNLVIFGNTAGSYLTTQQMQTMGLNTKPDGQASPDAQKVHFLFPSSGAPTNNLVSFSVVDSRYDARIEWVSRLELLNQVCKGIDYQYYVTGIGDIVFEFPMYDFSPKDFGETYNKLYTFERHLTNDMINDEGGTPISALEITSRNIIDEYVNPAEQVGTDGPGKPNELIQTVFSNTMAARLGVHVETHFIPGVTDQGRLAQLGLIEFNKRLAQFDKMDSDVTYRPYVGVNRPIYNAVKQRIGLTESTTATWPVAEKGEVTLSCSLGYLRKFENGTFRFITGGEATPISYSKVYDGVRVPGSGVNYDKTGQPKPVAADPLADTSN